MSDVDANRRFWQIYTPRNIRDEIRHRLAALRVRRTRPSPHPIAPATPEYDDRHARDVGRFYDVHHHDFMNVYGDVIQAFRTRDITRLLDHQMASIGLRPGQTVLDAGCGVGAPAAYFAAHAGVTIDAITMSATQADAARERVARAGLNGRIRVVLGDYHRLPDYFPAGGYDAIYFLESFGHSRAKAHLIDVCWEMLKPGGTLYVKDLFVRVPLRPEHAAAIAREIARINAAYRYDVGDLNAVLDAIRGRGFIVETMKSIDLELSDFEDLAISNQFQALTGLAPISDWDSYVFPVDFFELKCVKPEFPVDQRLDRHFLQQRLHGADSTLTTPGAGVS